METAARLLHLPRRAVRARTAELLAAFDLEDARDRRAGTYSGGMKRRLDLAISMIDRPELVVLDEPAAGLDPRSRDQVRGTVRDLADDGVTILLTTQYLEEADQLAGMIAMLDRGQVVARGTAGQLKSSIGTEVIRLQFGDRRSYNRALGQLDAVRADRRLHILEIASNGSADRVRDLLSHLQAAGAPALKVSTHRPSLDDVFLSLTGGEAAGDHAPRRFSGSSRSRMSCDRAAWPAGGVSPTGVSRSRGPSRPPGASRAFARRAVITRPAPGMLQIAVSVVFMVSPWRSALVSSAVPVSCGWRVIPELWICGETDRWAVGPVSPAVIMGSFSGISCHEDGILRSQSPDRAGSIGTGQVRGRVVVPACRPARVMDRRSYRWR